MTTSITATAEPGNAPPRVRLDITSDQDDVVIWRVTQSGQRTPVRTFDGGPLPITSGEAIIYDYEMPLDLPVTYTADGTGITPSGYVTVTHDRVWLVHPGLPALSQPVTVAAMSGRTHEANQAVRYPLSREHPIVATDGRRKAAQYDLTVRTRTLTEKQALDDLLADLSPLLLNVPAGMRWGQDSEYVQIGTLVADRIVQWGPHPYRHWRAPVTVVARPAGGTQAAITYATSYAEYPTYAARFAAHATYGQALDP